MEKIIYQMLSIVHRTEHLAKLGSGTRRENVTMMQMGLRVHHHHGSHLVVKMYT